MNKPPHILTTLPELRAAHPEAWAYMHILDTITGRLSTYGLDLDTFEWNGQVDDVLEDDTNATLPPPDIEDLQHDEFLSDAALDFLKENHPTLTFEDYGGQAFSENLIPDCHRHQAILSVEYEEV